ncbi:MAG: hypothetical protein ACQES1_07170 [Bacteroidota bacterium]
MLKNQEIFFHVGLPKTASTYLQRKVFPKFKGIHYVKKHDFKKHDAIIARSKMPLLFSTEMDLGIGKPNAKKAYDFAEKYPDTKVILVLRRHDKWIASKYKYYIRKNGTLPFREFFNVNDKNNSLIRNEHLEYRTIIALLEKLYNHKPLVMFQEEFKNDPDHSLSFLAQYCKAELDPKTIKKSRVNTSFNNKQLHILQAFNNNFVFDNHKHNKLTKKLRAFLNITLAFFSNIVVPESRYPNPLIPKEDLENIRKTYEKDWQYCVDYAAHHRKVYL